MSKLHTLLLSAVAVIGLAAPTMATQKSPQSLSVSTSTMAIGNPHPASEAHAANNARIEERRRADVADWQTLLGSQQPFPAMGVGGHPR
ncbi:hypothetical protein [Paramagnetospirillum caucaseum]|uniref:hypothetical protein n=1 Tax=Paramagnetospirillum caucaseum TaxID=1244869 RepID=UPI00034B24C0|nr:hypothetical protein [Paramagnetospirillum caucaseum]